MAYLEKYSGGLPNEFRQAATPADRHEAVTVQIEADLMQFVEGEGLDLQRHINGLLRFYMDTSQTLALDSDLDGFEPGENDRCPAPNGIRVGLSPERIPDRQF